MKVPLAFVRKRNSKSSSVGAKNIKTKHCFLTLIEMFRWERMGRIAGEI